jgi:hypothetical protein
VDETREFLANRVNSRGKIKIDKDDIIFFNGLGDAIARAYSSIRLDARIIMPEPTYSTHFLAEVLHASFPPNTYRMNPYNNWHPDMRELEQKVKSHKSIVGILVINPDNPTGFVYPIETLKRIVRIAQENDLFFGQSHPDGSGRGSGMMFQYHRVGVPMDNHSVAEGEFRRRPADGSEPLEELPVGAGLDGLGFEGQRSVAEDLRHPVVPDDHAFQLARTQRAVIVCVQVDQKAVHSTAHRKEHGSPGTDVVRAEGCIDLDQPVRPIDRAQSYSGKTGFDVNMRCNFLHADS